MALTNVFSDVGVTVIPFFFIWDLNVAWKQKLAAGGMFLTAAV